MKASRRERLRAAGLLLAGAGSAAPSAPVRRTQLPPATLPLSALLSQALVAFTIEFDNEAEHRLPHRTTSHGASSHGDATWLVSLAMWENCMRYVTAEPITVGDLEARARTRTNLDGMRRWGYITIDGTARKVNRGRPGPDAVLRATPAGLRAREIWRPLAGLVERRWHERFTRGVTDALRACLEPLAAGDPPPLFAGLQPYPDNWRASVRSPVALPHFLMVLHRGGYPDGS